MIVVDSSALIAILQHESDAAAYATVVQQAERLLVSAVNVHETGMLLPVRHGASAVDRMWRFLRDENDFEIVPFDEAQVRAAAAAFDRYGKGIHSQARLNLADCAAYALAMTMDLPLLSKGDDFTATGVRACLQVDL
ncbi:MAG: type II toxin-antitoxin system VapC family toxin [Methylocella sp.]